MFGKLRLRMLLLLLTGVGILPSFAQEDTVKTAKLDRDFRFKDGIFLSFDQVKENNPIPKAYIVTIVPLNDQAFYDKVLSHQIVTYYDDNGYRHQVKKENIWGYSRNGILYVQVDGNFNRITIVGGICHFVGTRTVMDTRYYDPYNRYYYPAYSYYYPPTYQTTTTQRTEMRQFILDFETGKIMEYSVRSVEVALMRDPELYDEYARLGPSKKKQMRFMYIRKFNERNPVYLPVKEQ